MGGVPFMKSIIERPEQPKIRVRVEAGPVAGEPVYMLVSDYDPVLRAHCGFEGKPWVFKQPAGMRPLSVV